MRQQQEKHTVLSIDPKPNPFHPLTTTIENKNCTRKNKKLSFITIITDKPIFPFIKSLLFIMASFP